METLPWDIVDLILFRLDPKSVVMMQCTNRSNNAHISDDDEYFKSEYLSRSGTGLIRISSFGSSLLSCYSFGDSRSFRNNDPLEISTRILSSCSGLLLLFMEGGTLCVANPLTKRFRFPGCSKSKFLCRVDRRGNCKFLLGGHQMNRIGFAVDQIDRATQRFKIVCMQRTDGSKSGETMYQFEISTGDSCWRLSETIITCSSSGLMADMKPVYMDGSLHWIRNDGSILAFNPQTEKGRLIPIKFPLELSPKNLFTDAEDGLALISATEEVICVYVIENILTDPKWVLRKRIRNGVLDKERMRYWNVGAYDGNFLVVREMKTGRQGPYEALVHGYDVRANKWEIICSIPEWSDSCQSFYPHKLSCSSVIELNKKVDVEMMTLVNGDVDIHISSLSKIMSLIDKISPHALTWLKKTEVPEEETKLKRMMMESSTKLMGLEGINKRRRTTRNKRITFTKFG